jgi:hypothetical protein
MNTVFHYMHAMSIDMMNIGGHGQNGLHKIVKDLVQMD